METQRRLKDIKNNWGRNYVQELQTYADTYNIHKLYATLRAIIGLTKRLFTPVRSALGALLRSQDEILGRWKEHFMTLLNETNE